MRQQKRFGLYLCLLALSGSTTLPTVRAQLMPDYRIGVGSTLFYETRTEHGADNTIVTRSGTNVIHVVGRTRDGNWQIALWGTLTSMGPGGELVQIKEQLNLFEMTPRGRILDGDAPQDSDTHHHCFIPLPAAVSNVLSSWDVEWDEGGERHQYQFHAASEPERGKWYWTRADSGLQKDLYGVSRTAIALFNAQVGLLERMETRFEISVPEGRIRGITTSQLRRSDLMLNFELKKLLPNISAFRDVRSRYIDTLGTIVSSASEPADTMNDAALLYRSATNDLVYPFVAKTLLRELAGHYETRDAYCAQADYWRAKVGGPAQVWVSETVDGKAVSSTAATGLVTLVHFWLSDNVITVRGLRKLDTLAAGLAGSPVRILSANLDPDTTDTLAAITASGVQHTVIKGAPLLQGFGLKSLPAVLVFDPEGVLRDVRFGEHAYRRDALHSSIEKLLKD